jgi:uncharacterized protein YqgC (DUF456 family)
VTPLLWVVVALLVLLGLVGTVVPGLPGPILVLAGLALAVWMDGFVRAGWPTLAVLAGLTILTYVLDLVATAVGARRFGASRWAVAGAVVGALVGLFFGLPGLLLGPFVGAFLVELLARRDVGQAGWAGLGAWLGFLVGTAGKLAVVVAMVAVFLVAYFRGG